MNQYIIIALVWLSSLLGVGVWQNHSGHVAGVNAQKVSDQVQFDKINQERADQKTAANAEYRKVQDENLALMADREAFKTTLEKEREKNRIATNALRDKYSSVGLRFATGQGAGLGRCSCSTQSPGANSPSSDGPSVVQLPDKVTSDLRQLEYDADTLADEYRKCYSYAQQVK